MPSVAKNEFEGKIIYPNMAKEFIAYLDTHGFFTNQKCFILSDNKQSKERILYLTAILNSKTNFWSFKQIGATLGASGYEMSKIFVEKLPVIEREKADFNLIKKIENLATQILESKRCLAPMHTRYFATTKYDKHGHSDNPLCHSERSEESLKDVSLNSQHDVVEKTQHDSEESSQTPPSPARLGGVVLQSQQTSQLEKELDSLIYELYGLSGEEIALIESEFNSKERERERD